MCLAVPAKVVSFDEAGFAAVDLDGMRRSACIDLVPDVRLGDYVIVHAGFAISILDPDEALETLELFRQLNELVPELKARPVDCESDTEPDADR